MLSFSEFRTMRNHLSETLVLNDIQITSDCLVQMGCIEKESGSSHKSEGS
jgi:hypothetical protein